MITDDANLMRWAFSSLALFFILGAFALLAKKIGPIGLGAKTGSKRRIALKETLHLDSRHKLCIVSIDGQEQCLAISPENTCVIAKNLSEQNNNKDQNEEEKDER